MVFRLHISKTYHKAAKLKIVPQMAMTNMTEMYMAICEPGSSVQNWTQRSGSVSAMFMIESQETNLEEKQD